MKIELKSIKIKDIVDKFSYSEDTGITGLSGKLDIRPPYQREFVYKDAQKEAVIDTVYNGLPLNVFYWAKTGEDRYEIIDGQQRTISICQFVNGDFSYKGRYFHNMFSDEAAKILDYELMVYVCDGLESEKLKWFRTINIAGEKLTEQELRNAVYAGPWLSDAKRFFSKNKCAAESIASDYMTGSPIRQDYLQTVIDWISDGNIEEYMARHQKEPNASELWRYFQSVITWVETIYKKKRPKFMKGVPWGTLYNKYSDIVVDTDVIESEISRLIQDDDVTSKKGIYTYLLDKDEKHLSIRKFSDSMKHAAYERQSGVCPRCGKHFEIEEMEADHIKPWSLGGSTVLENCQCLCKSCNRTKSSI